MTARQTLYFMLQSPIYVFILGEGFMSLKSIQVDKNFKDIKLLESITKQSFPPEEYVSPSIIIDMAEKDKTIHYLALYDQQNLVGYVVVKLHKIFSYLLFLAINPIYRSNGYGSKAIDFVKNKFKDCKQVVDFEMPDKESTNNEQRIRRRNFYLRNGYKPTGEFVKYKGISFEIFSMDDGFNIELYKEMLQTLKIKGYKMEYEYFTQKN